VPLELLGSQVETAKAASPQIVPRLRIVYSVLAQAAVQVVVQVVEVEC
jgi:hypothetical protein